MKQELQELNQASLDLQVQYQTIQKEKEEVKNENKKLSQSVEEIQKQVSTCVFCWFFLEIYNNRKPSDKVGVAQNFVVRNKEVGAESNL